MKKEEKKLFPAQEESELVLDIVRRHWFSYLIFWFLAVIMLVPVLIGVYFWFGSLETISPVLSNVIILIVPMYLLFIVALLIYGFVDFYLDVYIVTDRRIVDISQNGFFKRSISELNLRQIQDVSAEVNGFFSTLLHFGDIHIQTAGEIPNFVFQSIPHPYEVSKKILDLHEAYLQKIEKKDKNKQSISGKVKKEDKASTQLPEDLQKTLTEKWFDEGSEACYSDESCRQKVLEGLNKHLDELQASPKKEHLDQQGELKEGKEVSLE